MSNDKQTGVEVQISGQNGNIFVIMGRVHTAMKRAGFAKESKELVKEVTSSHSYSEALEAIGDYVEVF